MTGRENHQLENKTHSSVLTGGKTSSSPSSWVSMSAGCVSPSGSPTSGTSCRDVRSTCFVAVGFLDLGFDFFTAFFFVPILIGSVRRAKFQKLFFFLKIATRNGKFVGFDSQIVSTTDSTFDVSLNGDTTHLRKATQNETRTTQDTYTPLACRYRHTVTHTHTHTPNYT